MDLSDSAQWLRLFSDSTRVRLLVLLEQEELTVAELAAATKLAQPRVSTHLAKLKEAGLVRDRRSGVSAYYRFAPDDECQQINALWNTIRSHTTDPLLQEDASRLEGVLAARAHDNNWADSVAGDMERHYSPGRTWEATTRALVRLLELGDILDVASGDGVFASLIADRARSMTCLDISEAVVQAGRERLKQHANVQFEKGDMHDIPAPDGEFDLVTMLHALTYSKDPALAVMEAARVLKSKGKLLISTLRAHPHENAVSPFDHANQGFRRTDLKKICTDAGLSLRFLDITSREKRAPHFEVITVLAEKS